MYDELVKKVDAIQAIDASKLVTKINYDTKIKNIEEKILIKIIILLLLNLISFLAQYLVIN